MDDRACLSECPFDRKQGMKLMKYIKKKYLCIVIVSVLCIIAAAQNTVEANERSKMKIRIKIGKEVLTATMLTTETSRDFISMLPLTQHMKDYSGTEKISYPPRKLTTKCAPAGYDPSAGDIAYYSPWGNLAVFYKDFGYSKGLIKLGSIDGGIKKLAGMQGDFDAVFELID